MNGRLRMGRISLYGLVPTKIAFLLPAVASAALLTYSDIVLDKLNIAAYNRIGTWRVFLERFLRRLTWHL